MRPIDIILAVVAFGIIALAWYIVGVTRRRQMQQRIARVKKRQQTVSRAESLRRKTTELKGLIYWLTKPLPDFKDLGYRLERAGRVITPKQYVVRRALNALVIIFIVGIVMNKSLLLAVPLGLVGGVWIPLQWLDFQIGKQAKAFLRLFPDAIDLIVRGLRSGLPVSESMVLVAQEVPAPVGPTFATVSHTMKLGVPLEKALQEMAKKLDLSEFNFFTTSILLQRETGGNLSEILNNLSEVLRNRYLMRMKIKAMSSEARASTYIIGALPFVVIAAIAAISPQYMEPLFTDPRGNFWLAVAIGMMGSGLWVMHKMSNFEI